MAREIVVSYFMKNKNTSMVIITTLGDLVLGLACMTAVIFLIAAFLVMLDKIIARIFLEKRARPRRRRLIVLDLNNLLRVYHQD